MQNSKVHFAYEDSPKLLKGGYIGGYIGASCMGLLREIFGVQTIAQAGL